MIVGIKEKILEYFADINTAYNDCTRYETLSKMLDEFATDEDAISRQSLLELMGEEPFNWTDSDKEVQAVEDYRNFKNMVEQLPSVKPQYTDDEIQKMQDLEQAELQKAYELGKAEAQKWIPDSERLPEDFGLYLITLENGDVCQCEFNPDFIDEEHENGAFTYYHQYFDHATLGMIDEEEEAVDAIAWMPFKPYEPQERSENVT